MANNFTHDVFLSHSSKDKAVVRALAERLRKDSLNVWFDEWEIQPGDSIPSKIEKGLESSRVLVLCMSVDAFGSDWAQLEAGTFRFRDPLNKERRFIPLRLDSSHIKGSLAQFLYIDWVGAAVELEYTKLLEACRPPKKIKRRRKYVRIEWAIETIRIPFKVGRGPCIFSSDGKLLLAPDSKAVKLWDIESNITLRTFEDHTLFASPCSIAWSNDQRYVLIASERNLVKLWDVNKGECVSVLEGTDDMLSVALAPDQRYALSNSYGEHFILLWDISTKKCIRKLKGHTNDIYCLEWSLDGQLILSGGDTTIRIWDSESGRCLRVLEGHGDFVMCVAWSNDQQYILSGADDLTVRMWDVETGHCLHILRGHKSSITSIAFSPNNRLALTSSFDKTIRLWNLEIGECICVLKGHSTGIVKVTWSTDGLTALSIDITSEIRKWDLSEFVAKEQVEEITLHSVPDQVQYTNAKVLIVGDSGVGKSGLSNYLAHGIKIEEDKPIPSTDGAWATHWPLSHTYETHGVEREIWLWDFAGQLDYRLVHQLYMDDSAAAILVFNPQNENPFEGLAQWDRDLQKAARRPFAKLLTAGRVDRGGLVVSIENMKNFMDERGFLEPLHLTSAKTEEGCNDLREAIVNAIDWKSIPETTSPALYQRLKQEILNLRDKGLTLIRLSELKQRMEMTLRPEDFILEELDTVVGLLSGPGMIQRLDFGGFILLRPEVLSRYAAAVVRKVRKHPQELGCIFENELLAGDLDYQDFVRLPDEDEKVVLRTLLETFISRAWCLRQPCDGTALLSFPSYFRRERKEQLSHPSVLVTYRFDGPTDEIYSTLVVRLHYTIAFESVNLWKSAADFKTQSGASLGFAIMGETEGTSRLEVYFDPSVTSDSQVLFLRYVHDHLSQHAQNVLRLRRYYCADKNCDGSNEPFGEQHKIDRALALGGRGKVFCSDCGKPIHLHDLIEEKFDSPIVRNQAREMERGVQVVLDNESRELMAVYHAGFIVAEAGQIYRGYTNSDHGIDGEIEFKDNLLKASGKRLYLQLKSGDSYLKKRERDGAEIFQIKNPRWAEYWQQQAYPVMLVIRTSDGEIRWMDVSAYLKRKGNDGKIVKQIIFKGERMDVMSVRHWRDQVLKESQY
jgi:WD40 repeat protein